MYEFYLNLDLGHRSSEATKMSVTSEDEVHTLLSSATAKRRVRQTNMNSISSRSHAIFTIYLRIEQEGNDVRNSAINLVDLAGSEGSKKTGNTGEAHAESKRINESLSAFKRVINALATNSKHIPIRDSMITRVLESSYTLLNY